MEEREAYISLVKKYVSQVEVNVIYIFRRCYASGRESKLLFPGSKMCYSSGKEGNLYFIVLKCVIVVKEKAIDTQFILPSYFALKKKKNILVPVTLVVAHCFI